jgi:hypothetical protein
MKWWFGFALAQLAVCGTQNGTALAPITLYTQFAEQPPAAVRDAMQDEVRSIMAPMGLRFRWMNLAESNGKQVSIELAVIEFSGRCDVGGLSPRDGSPGPLGWTHVSDGVILPFANVDCAAVRSFIQKELLDIRLQTRAATFGRALGRVLAHELYHIFANTKRHGSEGVGREFYSARDLLAADFQFQAKESMALINGKAHAALMNASVGLAEEAEHRY